MQLFDTHSHYNLDPIYSNYITLMQQAQHIGITKSMVVGTDFHTSQKAIELKQAHPDFFLASIGLHPSNINEEIVANSQAPNSITNLVNNITNLMSTSEFDAYGELGLDFFRLDKKQPVFEKIMTAQLDVLRQQLRFIVNQPKAVIIHVRDDFCQPEDHLNAYHLILKTIHEEKAQNLKTIFHCFSGNQAYLAQVLTLPQSYISFAGNLTFKSAHQLRQCFVQVPVNRLLLETDSPFLSPEPKRGQYCQPSFLKWTAEYSSKQLNADLLQIYQNSIGIFS